MGLRYLVRKKAGLRYFGLEGSGDKIFWVGGKWG